jgi:hypothetical protein
VFAGAAREAVFSNPEVIRRVKADFIPVALKAALVNNPPSDEEGQLYREVARSKPAPQGICAVNSAGKVLDWALMFDDDQSVVSFFDHVLARFAEHPDARQPFSAERYMRFPSVRLEDGADSGKVLPVPDRHRMGKSCPAQPPLRAGTMVARVIGRALGKDGKPVASTVRQENYTEDRFQVPVDVQERLARAAAAAGNVRFRIPDDLARLIVTHAYLGQIDVNPLGSPAGGRGDLEVCELWGQRVASDAGVAIHIEGQSKVKGGEDAFPGQNGDGRGWRHEVQLSWDGSIEIEGNRMTRLLLLAHGSEKLNWGNRFRETLEGFDVAHLPGGHLIDLACGVRYGVIGEPSAEEHGVAAEAGAPAEGAELVQVPDEARRQLIETLGPPFLVFHAKVQAELKLSDDQKQKLEERLQEQFQEAMQFFQRLEGSKPEERPKELDQYRRKAQDGLSGFLQKNLEPDQQKRLRQIMLQHEGSFALLNPEIAKDLTLTDEQRQQLMAIVQEFQKKIQPLMEEAQAKGNPEAIRPRAMQLRDEHRRKLEAVLNDAQKKQWKEMLGKSINLGD